MVPLVSSWWSFEVDDKHLVTTQTWELSGGNKVALLGTTQQIQGMNMNTSDPALFDIVAL